MLLPTFSVAAQAPASLAGFRPEHVAAQRALETQFDGGIDAKDQLAWLKRLSARPHHMGSPYGLSNAQYLRDLYASFGFDAKIETFQVLFAEPKERTLTLGGFRAKLDEPPIKGDPESARSKEALPVSNCYSCDGDVRGQVVYANFGLEDDYKALAERGVDVRGKIVLVRYGSSFRGIKPKVAAQHGAIGCLIYSDPKDDGYVQGDEYPKGGWRDRNSAQRGSVADITTFQGDPLTPGIGSVPGAPRLKREDSPMITKIPTQPLSWGDAEPLLRDMTGPVAPLAWRGGLPFAYRMGPTRQQAHLKLTFDWKTVDCRDVIATLKGSELPDEWIVRGNHHDAWVCGANDPLAGQVAILGEAKAIGALVKTGWRPKRTIVYCSWDGEEPGLVGSTEWVEAHQNEVASKVALYVNSDTNERGLLSAGGSQELERFFTQAAQDVKDPETGTSVADRARANAIVNGTAEARRRARAKGDLPLSALGSGSDYSAFAHHSGVASINLGFGGEGEGTQYHSVYDTYEYQTRFNDPGGVYGTVLSKTAGRLILRAANADVLPSDFAGLATAIDTYTKEVVRLVETSRTETEESNRKLSEGSLALANDPRETHILPKPLDPVPDVDLSPLVAATARFVQASKDAGTLSDAQIMAVGRALLGPGLPNRPWYRNVVTAAGRLTGYGAKTLPGVREAIESREWKIAEEQAKVAATALDRATSVLTHGTK